MNRQQREVQRKIKVLEEGEANPRRVSFICRRWGVSRDTYYRWKRQYSEGGEAALVNSRPCPENTKIRVKPEIEEKILYLRKTYHFGPLRICWYLMRYHGMKVSVTGVRGVLLRHGINRLPKNLRKKHIATIRYEKQMPGHHVQVDVKFLHFTDKRGKRIRRFQYTAVDDATRIRALRVYTKHTQLNAIDFVDYVIEKFPFRIKSIRTDNGHEFQAKFHWHVEDLGIKHFYIKPRSPRLNGKVERSHRTDQDEFYQLLTYKSDVDLEKKLKAWEDFYNYDRPHGSLDGRTPFEVMYDKLSSLRQQQRTSDKV